MVSVIMKTTLLMYFLPLIAKVATQSPCPNFFRYIRNEETNEVIGYIEIASPPRGVTLELTVSLSLAAALPSKYVGQLQLAESKEQSVMAVNQGRPLKYRIYFPVRWPIPLLTSLRFNNELICSGPRAIGPIVTSIVLTHQLFPPSTLPLVGNTISNEPDPTSVTTEGYHRPLIENTSTTRSTTTNNVKWLNSPECGINLERPINPLVIGGTKEPPGRWPWLVAIFIIKREFEFQCAGTLVTNSHIITAAHCFQLDNVNLPNGSFLVSIGRHRLRDWREKGSVNRDIAEYRLHPDYNTEGNADADVAVLVLREKVEYSRVIRPICLWSGPTNLEAVVGKIGHVVGWGRDGTGKPYVLEPRRVESPIVAQEDCLWSNPNFVSFTSNRTFCAGSRDGSGPCNGDSGSGLVIYDAERKRYYLRGVVSRSLFDNNMFCDLTQYVIYVDVAKHLDWIQKQISST